MIVGDITVDVCEEGCGGIWFDKRELVKFDEPHEHLGEGLLDINVNPSTVVDHSKKRQCPRCEGVIMMRHFFSVKRQVEVDECAACAGFWIDDGELKQIRGLFQTEAERKQAAHEYFNEMFGEQLTQLSKESQEKAEKARRISHMFRFICPSYYIPDEQDWGAF